MSMHINHYSQTGCRNCKQCERGAANVGRTAVVIMLVLFTGGFGALVFPFFKKCLYCKHNTFMDKHDNAQSTQPAQN